MTEAAADERSVPAAPPSHPVSVPDVSHSEAPPAEAPQATPASSTAPRLSVVIPAFNEAENSYYDETIEGDGGTILGLRGGLEWQAAPNHTFAAALKYDYQDLEGGTKNVVGFDELRNLSAGTVEWPDNELERLSLEASWMYSF